jgi:hypothetical protein
MCCLMKTTSTVERRPVSAPRTARPAVCRTSGRRARTPLAVAPGAVGAEGCATHRGFLVLDDPLLAAPLERRRPAASSAPTIRIETSPGAPAAPAWWCPGSERRIPEYSSSAEGGGFQKEYMERTKRRWAAAEEDRRFGRRLDWGRRKAMSLVKSATERLLGCADE